MYFLKKLLVRLHIGQLIFLVILGVAGYAGYVYYHIIVPVESGSGILVRSSPKQQSILLGKVWRRNGFSIRPVARYSIEGRVLAKGMYFFDKMARVAPYDLVLGWGRLSDGNNLEKITVTASRRQVFYKWDYQWADSPPISENVMQSNMSVTHIIPGGRRIALRMHKIRPGHIVTLKGYLVNMVHDKGWEKNTSLSRKDFGAGSGEVMMVNELSYR